MARRRSKSIAKRAANVSVRSDLLAAAREAGINLAATLERAFGELQTRAVIPLSKEPSPVTKPLTRLFPKVEFEGEGYWVITTMLAGIARNDLVSMPAAWSKSDMSFLALLIFCWRESGVHAAQ